MKHAALIAAVLAGTVALPGGLAMLESSGFASIAHAADEKPTVVTAGSFRDADEAHKGSGEAAILRKADGSHELRFTEFKSTDGPDLKVYLVKSGDVQESGDVTASEWISLGRLKDTMGEQSYALPGDADPGAYGSAVIWCERFGVLFSAATLTREKQAK